MAAIFCNNLLTCFPIIFPILLPRFCFLDGPPDGLPCQQKTSFGVIFSATAAPASNKPHSAEKSTLVWLAIWHIWAGFANSQLLRAAFRSTY